MKRIASIQDISCIGRCSLTVALPVLSAMGVECGIMPTAVLSTHTMFPDFTCADLSDELLPIARHWKSQQVHFDAVYTGYLASAEQVATVLEVIDTLTEENTLVYVDPAMADHGKLYPAFGPEFPAEMAKVVARADITVPNITEACMMTGREFREEYDEAYIHDLLKAVAALGAKKVVLTGVSFDKDLLGCMAYDSATGEFFSYYNRREPASYHGTGDLFSSVVLGGLMRDLSLEDSLKLAVDYTQETIHVTRTSPNSVWYGVEFERTIPMLCRRLGDM